MGSPAFQISGQSAAVVPKYHLGSDSLRLCKRKRRAEITLYRHGVPVASYWWWTGRVWDVVINITAEANVTTLAAYHAARYFDLLPDIDVPATAYPVFWETDDFQPQQVKPGYYSLRFRLVEVPAEAEV